MKHIRILALSLILTAAFAGLSSCEDSDQKAISNAQACLDKANSKTTADACIAQLGTLRSAEAYSIICSAHFIAQGFTTIRFVGAYNALSASGTGTNPMAAALALMSFDATGGADGSTQTLTDCKASNVQSLIQLSVLAQMATLIGSTIPGGEPATGYTPAQIATAIATYSGDPTALGNTAITAGQVYCATGSSYTTSSVCKTLSTAIGSSTSPAAIGTALLAQLQIANP